MLQSLSAIHVNISPSGKHWDVICKKTACFPVIPRICLNVGLWQRWWNTSSLDCEAAFIASSWWKLGRCADQSSSSCHLISDSRQSAASLTHAFTAPIQLTRAHRAQRKKVLSLCNPHYSRCTVSIWWVSESCSVHPLHSPAPTYPPFI